MVDMDAYDEDVIPEGASTMLAKVVQPFTRYQACAVEIGNYFVVDTYVLERSSYDALGWGTEVYRPGNSFEGIQPEYEFVDKTLAEVLAAVRSAANDTGPIVQRVLKDHEACVEALLSAYDRRDASFFEFPPRYADEWVAVSNGIIRLREELEEASA